MDRGELVVYCHNQLYFSHTCDGIQTRRRTEDFSWTYGRAPNAIDIFVGFFKMHIQATTRGQPYYTVFPRNRPVKSPFTHFHNVKALRLAPRHKSLTTLADIFRADLVYLICNGCGMPAGIAYNVPFRTPGSVPHFGTC